MAEASETKLCKHCGKILTKVTFTTWMDMSAANQPRGVYAPGVVHSLVPACLHEPGAEGEVPSGHPRAQATLQI